MALVIEHIDEAQTALGRRLLLENPATYVRFAQSAIPETEFLQEIARATGCGLLLDVNNVFVSARNHEIDASAYLEAFPLDLVGEIHLAGHFETVGRSRHRRSTSMRMDRRSSTEVFALFESVIARAGPLPTLIEWDNDVPEWPVLRAEALAAQRRLDRADLPAPRRRRLEKAGAVMTEDFQTAFAKALRDPDADLPSPG